MWARNFSIKALKEVIEAPDRKSDVVAAVRELNVMHGFHEAQKIEHSGAITSIERRIVDARRAVYSVPLANGSSREVTVTRKRRVEIHD